MVHTDDAGLAKGTAKVPNLVQLGWRGPYREWGVALPYTTEPLWGMPGYFSTVKTC